MQNVPTTAAFDFFFNSVKPRDTDVLSLALAYVFRDISRFQILPTSPPPTCPEYRVLGHGNRVCRSHTFVPQNGSAFCTENEATKWSGGIWC